LKFGRNLLLTRFASGRLLQAISAMLQRPAETISENFGDLVDAHKRIHLRQKLRKIIAKTLRQTA